MINMSFPKSSFSLWKNIGKNRFYGMSSKMNATTAIVENEANRNNLSADTIAEVKHHDKMAADWWNPNGPLKGLHSLNEVRVPFIRDGLIAVDAVNKNLIETTKVLEGVNILEVGCGGGVLTEKLARINANVTAIDLGHNLISVAKEHLKNESLNLSSKISYRVESIQDHAKENKGKYDAVVISEVIEHISDKIDFLSSCLESLKIGGSIFITTPNKTIPSLVCGIMLAENVFNVVPKGTHDFQKFISPLELQRILDSMNCSTILLNGLFYEIWSNRWIWTSNNIFCYALQAIKME